MGGCISIFNRMSTEGATSDVKSSTSHKSENFDSVWWHFLIVPGFALYGYVMRQYFQLYWAYIFLAYGVIPMLDQIFDEDWTNPTLKQMMKLEHDQRYRMVVYSMVVLDIFIFVSEVGSIGTFTVFNALPRLFVLADSYSKGILISHELTHKENLLDRTVGSLILIKNCYLHYTIDHIYSHHKWVSTPEDTSSAPRGMTLYEFVPRNLKGAFISAYKISPKLVILGSIASLSFLLVLYKIYGWKVLLIHLAAAAGSIQLLETANYIEHYGLRRKKLADGTYEKVTVRHSWNAAHRISNYLFLKLQRHSDHHENSLKPYQTLCTYEDSPQLPHGYLVCLLVAQFPKVIIGLFRSGST
jgi:alkane 1-monooxygenase